MNKHAKQKPLQQQNSMENPNYITITTYSYLPMTKLKLKPN